ncbi:MAG: sugar ABC transporter substrate-binding protein [Lachnospiraceae bacterium]|nr:sugar ABC transporter substrate-binding protein [Lachnospiraceae bacterium]
MKKHKIFSIMLVGAMALSLAACGSTGDETTTSVSESDTESAADTSDISVGIVLKTATNSHFKDMAYGAVMAGEELGITVKVDNTSTETDVEGQITKCENLISSGVDALILTANDTSGVTQAVQAAHDAGIPFVTVDTEIDNIWGDDVSEYMPNFIGTDYEEIAYNLAVSVFEKLGGEGNIVVIRGVDSASSSQQRVTGVNRAIAEYDGIIQIDTQSANYDQDEAVSTMSDIIQAHPSESIDAVICLNDLMAVGVITALEENDMVAGEGGTIVVGLDGNLVALQQVEAGKLYADSYDYAILQGYYAVMQAYELIQGEEVPEITYAPDVLVTQDNVDEYMEHAEILSSWSMSGTIDEIPDSMWEFLETGKEYEITGGN